jgi:hypothetical protein
MLALKRMFLDDQRNSVSAAGSMRRHHQGRCSLPAHVIACVVVCTLPFVGSHSTHFLSRLLSFCFLSITELLDPLQVAVNDVLSHFASASNEDTKVGGGVCVLCVMFVKSRSIIRTPLSLSLSRALGFVQRCFHLCTL